VSWRVSERVDFGTISGSLTLTLFGLVLAGLVFRAGGVNAPAEFGKERFDLILFSWSMPLIPVEKVIASLKPGGIIVMECATHFVGRNGMLKMFDSLEITRYEIVRAKADFENRMETDVLRLMATKPR
jgi:hypothetical protein